MAGYLGLRFLQPCAKIANTQFTCFTKQENDRETGFIRQGFKQFQWGKRAHKNLQAWFHIW
ncbi:hypothetical protein OI70_13410 [Dickeya fangzhongdai]|nr:hypothetical protein LH89_03355 [Dickeya fangzhongdai]KGT99711.1 hypothetical protein NM75_02515 [Dickeya fangzhongdai]KHN55611.1 hypothetical protein OI70_13410 [Dickeya fangzhongdai]